MFKSAFKYLAENAVAAALLGAPVHAAETFDLFGSYNGIFFGDYSLSNSDIEGALAVGGNAYLSSFSVGDKLVDPDYALVVGGDLTTGSGRIYYGDVAVGGAANLDSSVYWGLVNNGQSYSQNDVTLPIDFAAVAQLAKDTSSYYAGLGATGDITSEWGTFTVGNADGASDLQIFHMTAEDLKAAHTFNLSSQPVSGSAIVINVSGSTIDFSNMGTFFAPSQSILFNFYEAETVQMSGIGVWGNILAPTADFFASSGQVNGVVIGGSWNGGLQVNNSLGFNDDSWKPGTSVPAIPEPSTWLMVRAGFGFVTLTARRRGKRRVHIS